MNNEQRVSFNLTSIEVLSHESSIASYASCELDAEGHCITCSDEVLQARVLRVDEQSGVAFVMINDATEEVDISLVDDVVLGDMLLVHGGVAISRLDEASDV
ncbi:MAG TPA: HypC/HybG/HupF family hydrogenase formation chaperone [Ktedonobacteraceae bacterium]|nr:HypC/HybG/HupF family hydrogenase formation chaperone [Ktedonobacteraceae bacterium]